MFSNDYQTLAGAHRVATRDLIGNARDVAPRPDYTKMTLRALVRAAEHGSRAARRELKRRGEIA